MPSWSPPSRVRILLALALVTAAATAASAQPLQTEYVILEQPSQAVALFMIHIPGTDRYLFAEKSAGHRHPDGHQATWQLAGTYDLGDLSWVPVGVQDTPICGGLVPLSNGSIAIFGGGDFRDSNLPPDGRWGIRTFSDGDASLTHVSDLRYARYYPSATLLPDSTVLIMGGTEGVGEGTYSSPVDPYYEIWDPKDPQVTQQLPNNLDFIAVAKLNYYPYNYVLPTGDMFVSNDGSSWIVDPYTADFKVQLPGRPESVLSPGTTYNTEIPNTGTSVMLTLKPEDNYHPEIMVFGGADSEGEHAGCRESLRIKIHLPSDQNAAYSWDPWVTESMGSPRVMPDATLLPNGHVILLNGAVKGQSTLFPVEKAPNFYAEMYNPDAPLGQRWTTLARSQIARLYHSSAGLTTNGTVLVAGSDLGGSNMVTDLPYSPSPYGGEEEYRVEVFYPPFWYDFENKPSIVSSPPSTQYGAVFAVKFSGKGVTGAVLVAPSATTHCFNMNQRVVKLAVLSLDRSTETLVVQAPPSPNHAPPQMYMLFLLNGDTYSTAKWIMLKA